MSNLRILRLTNTNLNVITESADKSSFTYNIPEDLVNLGRCLVEVVSGWVQVTRQTLDVNLDVDAIAGRIVPFNIPMVLVRSNIEQSGTDSFTNGDPNILGTCLLQNTSISSANVLNGDGTGTGGITKNVAEFCGSPHTFLCNRLPSVVKVEKLMYQDVQPPALIPANNFQVRTLPMEVILKLTFLDME